MKASRKQQTSSNFFMLIGLLAAIAEPMVFVLYIFFDPKAIQMYGICS